MPGPSGIHSPQREKFFSFFGLFQPPYSHIPPHKQPCALCDSTCVRAHMPPKPMHMRGDEDWQDLNTGTYRLHLKTTT